MKWGWTTSSNNLESVLLLQDKFNYYFYNNGKYSKYLSNECTKKKKKKKPKGKEKRIFIRGKRLKEI